MGHLLHPYADLREREKLPPLVITKGQGVYVYDKDGKEYLEAMAGLWCAALGFSEKRLAEAAYKQLNRLPYYHAFANRSHDVGEQLAAKLLAISPAPMSKVFFANSGSEANDSAIKLIWYYNNSIGRPKKKKIISRQRGYHGVTIATASLTGLPNNHLDFDLPIGGVLHTGAPYLYRGAKTNETEQEFAARLASELEALILREGPDSIAAFIAEPVMGSGGVLVPPESYFSRIQEVLKKYDILFIADEVICGFGRTGQMFGTQTFQLRPDVITLAKALSASYVPISAVLISDSLYQPIASNSAKIGFLGHGFTYSGHPVAAAVALEAIRIYEEIRIVDHVRSVSSVMSDQLQSLKAHPLVGDVRGIGLLWAIELVADKVTKSSFPPALRVGHRLVEHAQERGLILRALGDVIPLTPPLIINADEVKNLCSRLKQSLDAVLGDLRQIGSS